LVYESGPVAQLLGTEQVFVSEGDSLLWRSTAPEQYVSVDLFWSTWTITRKVQRAHM
jgi:hypothetical protein